jgi:hypothetical protein
VLLCNVKPAVQEDRRFCFEVKTKNQAILLQAETQRELMEWLGAFEIAKTKALEASASNDYAHPGGIDPAFAITPPLIPEFAAKSQDGHMVHGSEEIGTTSERLSTLPVPNDSGLAPRNSFDVTAPRRSITTNEGESSRDHATRIMQKLDLHRRSPNPSNDNPSSSPPPSSGIASLISASHNILPVYSNAALTQVAPGGTSKPQIVVPVPSQEAHTSTLAPSTLANPPAPTNLSKSAVIVSGERGIGIGRSDATGGMPSGIMANLWGSSNWGFVNRLEQDGSKPYLGQSMPPSPNIKPVTTPKPGVDENRKSIVKS